MSSVDELELELRRLPGVTSVGIEAGGGLRISLFVVGRSDAGKLAEQAELLGLGHHDHPSVQIVEASLEPVTLDLDVDR